MAANVKHFFTPLGKFTVRVKKSLPKDVKICLPRREKTPYHVVAKSSYRAHLLRKT